jgi:phosphate transport system substrate-binding protein
MMRLQRRIGLLLLIALIAAPTTLSAQDDGISIVGSAVMQPVMNALIDASGAQPALDSTISVTGTGTGINLFCLGQADIVMTTRALDAGEANACEGVGVEYLELLAGYNTVALVGHPEDTFAECLTIGQLRTIFAPSSSEQIVNWTQIGIELPFQDLAVYLPNELSLPYNLLPSIINTDGIRSDAQLLDDDAAVIELVSQTPGALGVVGVQTAQAAADRIRVKSINAGEAGCIAPTSDNIAANLYGGARPLFVYVNLQSLDKPGVSEIAGELADPANADLILSQGLLPANEESVARNASIIANRETGLQSSASSVSFTVPTTISGQVTIGGSPLGLRLLSDWTSAFASVYPAVTATSTLNGEPAGFRNFCSGQLDMVVAYENLPTDEIENCSLNNIVVTTLDLGSYAVGLFANAQSDYLVCLSTDQLVTAWSANPAGSAATWNQVDEAFPEVPITLFAPATTDLYADILLQSSSAPAVMRVDVEQNDDFAYRAAATANVEGALTYMTWEDFQAALASGQANITPVAVDAGNGCVAPTEETITDGTYALSRPLKLHVNRAALARQDVQAFLWYLAQDANYGIIQTADLIGLPISALAGRRAELETLFREAVSEVAAAAAAAAASAESTPDPQAEVTRESDITPEPTSAEGTVNEATLIAEMTATAPAGDGE